jgi:hypothetical protein
MRLHILLRAMTRSRVLAAMTAVLLSAGAFAQANSPEIGTWVLNVAKSNYSPGNPPKSEVRTYEAVGPAIRLTVTLVDTSGHTIVARVAYTADGKVTGITGNPGYDQIVVKRLSENEFRSTNLRSGKPVAETVAAVSTDRKTLTITQDITMGNGIKIHNVEVFDKQ